MLHSVNFSIPFRRVLSNALCIAASLRLLTFHASAQVYEEVFSFANAKAEISAKLAPRMGAFPVSALVLGKDGSFYGTTYSGGPGGGGVVFRLRPE